MFANSVTTAKKQQRVYFDGKKEWHSRIGRDDNDREKKLTTTHNIWQYICWMAALTGFQIYLWLLQRLFFSVGHVFIATMLCLLLILLPSYRERVVVSVREQSLAIFNPVNYQLHLFHLCTHNVHSPIVICLAKLFFKLFLLVITV